MPITIHMCISARCSQICAGDRRTLKPRAEAENPAAVSAAYVTDETAAVEALLARATAQPVHATRIQESARRLAAGARQHPAGGIGAQQFLQAPSAADPSQLAAVEQFLQEHVRTHPNTRAIVYSLYYLGSIAFSRGDYDLALTQAQIDQNFDAGVGKRLIMRFDVSQWAGPGSFIEFMVSEFDEFSYLFCQPTFVSPNATGFRVSNLRIAVNGVAPVAGQSFQGVDSLVQEPRQLLSRQCSVIAKDHGGADDVFTVEFETLGNFADPVDFGPPPVPPVEVFGDSLPREGLRDFDRVNTSMASLTGVDPNAARVRDTFQELEQQLPATFDLRTFSSSQQVGVAKLALEYCDAMVESSTLRTAFFGTTPAFQFDQPVNTAFSDQTKRDLIIDRLVDRMLGANIAYQPSRDEARPALNDLISELTASCAVGPCDAARTRNVVKGVCAAVLSSAAATVQ